MFLSHLGRAAGEVEVKDAALMDRGRKWSAFGHRFLLVRYAEAKGQRGRV